MGVAQCFEVAKKRYAWGRKDPMRRIEEIRLVPEEWQEGDNRFSVMLIRALRDKFRGRVFEDVEGYDK
eukprot:11428209-Prorocentrum_lima.AAC.1